MPKNSVTDPITDQEIAFAHLVLSGTMNDSQAAEAAGLNPTTAAYTKSKPRVRDYMNEHRAAVKEKLVEQEVEGLRNFNLGRDQILARLWELASLDPQATKGSIGGQIKAMSMIVAIEGLLPDRRISPAPGQLASPAINPKIYVSETMHRRPPAEMEPAESVTAVEAQPATPPLPEPPGKPADDIPSVSEDHGHTNPFTYPKGVSSAHNAIGPRIDAHTSTIGSLRLPLAPGGGRFGRGR